MLAKDVLLLNANSQPLRIISWQDAVNHLLSGKAIPDYCAEFIEIRTTSEPFRLPTILRLKYMVNVPDRNAKWSRSGVLRRDRWTCGYCGITSRSAGMHSRDFTVDHIIPRSRGGKNTWVNTVCSCKPCNLRKADRTPGEAGMKLIINPRTPRTSYLIISAGARQEWKIYLEIP